MKKISLIVIIFFLISNNRVTLLAQYSVYDFDPVVVTGSLNETFLSSSLRNITVIDRSLIESLNPQTIDDLLQYVIGLDLRSQGPGNIQTDVSIRGAGAEQTLIMIDGVAVTDPQTAHQTLNLPIGTKTIQQIEIIKGGASQLYGSGAYGGVINIITKKVEDSTFRFGLEAGSFGTFGSDVLLSLNRNKLHTQLSSDFQHSDGYRYNSDYENVSLFLKNTYQHSNVKYQLTTGYQKKDFGANDFYYVDKAEQRENTEAIFLNLTNLFNGLKGPLRTGLSWRNHYDHYIYDFTNPSIYENRHYTNTIRTLRMD